jgi:alpha-beta hydrolase superfamily lysophospholipase
MTSVAAARAARSSMQASTFRLPVGDGVELFVYRWQPEGGPPRAVLEIAHGMAEHGARYARLAERLTANGYAVYVPDQRGHGETATAPGDLGYFAERDGFAVATEDLFRLNRRIASDHLGVPLFLLGHSMGSLLAQRYLYTHGDSIGGAVLSGTSGGSPSIVISSAMAIAKLERKRLGPRGRSKLLSKLSFGGYNRRFKPARTEFDWLSSDPDEVDKYIADPFCGFDFTVQGWLDILDGVRANDRPENIARVPKNLPIYLFSGEQDPVGRETEAPKWLADSYRHAGVTDVTQRFYPGGRHEMFNERDRDRVERDLVAWLDSVLARRAGQRA